MSLSPEIAQVLACFPQLDQPYAAECLEGAGGFSGARLWRLTTSGATFCLRRWPTEHPSPDRLAWLHSVLRGAAARGFVRLPIPLPTTTGATWVQRHGYLWELTPWLPGEADFKTDPTPVRLRAALVALAEFHRAVADLQAIAPAPSPGIAQRVQQLERLIQGDFARIVAAVSAQPVAAVQESAERWLQLFPRLAEPTWALLTAVAALPVPLQPCIRDIWHDHVLFDGEIVTGLVDFGALRIDSVAGDVARLLGSLCDDDRQQWKIGLAAYESVRSLSATELHLAPAFDTSGVLLGATNWLEWIYVQHRHFDDLPTIAARLAAFVQRGENLAKSLESRLSHPAGGVQLFG